MSISGKQIIGEPLIINGRQLSLSRAVRAGDFVFLTGQIPMQKGIPMTSGTIEEQTRACLTPSVRRLHSPDAIWETSLNPWSGLNPARTSPVSIPFMQNIFQSRHRHVPAGSAIFWLISA
ncbi:MAG: hypothetical protein CM1200mP18_12040 [Gammaproteobacteria bacterium]|nr:MAG: hypothetical protein CM1200mP18_12040 [Gammaproteobacteria bacterium]